MAGRFSVEAVFRAVDRVTRPVSRMQQRVNRFTRSTSRGLRSLDRTFGKMHSGVTRVGAAFSATAALITGAGAAASQSGLDFEQAITDVGAVSLKTRQQIAPLEKLAKQLGATTKFTATEAANAMEVLARAGFNTQQILDSVPAVLSAAAASGLEIADVADHVSNVLKGMGLDMTQAAQVADVLALASARTNSSIGSLGESMRNVAATAKQLGVPLESAVASVALLQDVGLDASVAGSAFNVMLTKMAKPTKEIEKNMRRFGISFKDAKGNMLPLNDVLEQLSIAAQKAGGNFDKVAFLADLVGLRGQKAAANLADLFDLGKIQALTKELQNASGTAEKMANIRMDTTRGSLTLLASAVDAVKVQIFDMNSGPLKNTIDMMTKWVGENQKLIATRVTGFISKIIENLPEIWKWIKRIGKALIVFYAFGAILKTLIGVMTLVNLVMAANPVVLITLGIMALIAAIASAIIWWDEIKAAFQSLPGPVKVAITAITGPLMAFLKLADTIKQNWEPIKAFFKGLFSSIADVIEDKINRIKKAIELIQTAVSKVTGLASKVTGGVKDTTSRMFTGASEAASRVGSFFGFGDDDQDESPGTRQNLVSPGERIARSIEERRESSSAEVTIRDETGRAELTGDALGSRIKLQPSGVF